MEAWQQARDDETGPSIFVGGGGVDRSTHGTEGDLPVDERSFANQICPSAATVPAKHEHGIFESEYRSKFGGSPGTSSRTNICALHAPAKATRIAHHVR